MTLQEWLSQYADAAATYVDDLEHHGGRIDLMPPLRPRAMCFTVHEDGALFNAADVYLGNVAQLSPTDRRMLRLNPDWNPMPRRNPQAATTVITAGGPQPLTLGATPPPAAQPGDVIMHGGRAAGTLGLDGLNHSVLITTTPAEPGTSARERYLTNLMDTTHQCADLSGVSAEALPHVVEGVLSAEVADRVSAGRVGGMSITGINGANLPNPITMANAPSIVSAVRDGMTALNASMATTSTAVHAALEAATISARQAGIDDLQGADLSGVPDEPLPGTELAALRAVAHIIHGAPFDENTASHGTAWERARATYPLFTTYRAVADRAAREAATTSVTVSSNAGAVRQFLRQGYGIQLDAAALRAVAATVSVFARQTAHPLLARLNQVEETAARERTARVRLTAQLRTMTEARDALREATAAMAPVTPGRFQQTEAAVLAARAWKAAPISDSVGKRDAFLHLLATLEQLA